MSTFFEFLLIVPPGLCTLCVLAGTAIHRWHAKRQRRRDLNTCLAIWQATERTHQ